MIPVSPHGKFAPHYKLGELAMGRNRQLPSVLIAHLFQYDLNVLCKMNIQDTPNVCNKIVRTHSLDGIHVLSDTSLQKVVAAKAMPTDVQKFRDSVGGGSGGEALAPHPHFFG